MRRIYLPIVALLAVLVTGLVGLYLYDGSRADTVAEGVSVAGVDVGGMSAERARVMIQGQVAAPLEEPIRISTPGRDHVLTAKRARLRTDVDGSAAAALVASREGFFVTRAVRDLTGSRANVDLRARVSYSKRAVAKVVRGVERDVNRPARDATVEPSGAGLNRVRAQTGRRLHTEALARRLRSAIRRPDVRTVRARADVTKPSVLTGELEKRYPHYITVDRGGFRLRYYRNLEMKSSHRIAVGKVGLETPAGPYSIQNKAVDPAWQVPNSDWAGDLAGRTIPGGTAENPLKARWMGIFDGAGIHGTDETGSLGTNASHGCIRMAIPEVIELYKRVPVKTPIYIG